MSLLPIRRYWWVNHNKTHRQEIGGGYMWSPKRQKNGGRLVFYDNMREVRAGDVIFSFYEKSISAVGIAASEGYDCIVPPEFAEKRGHWDEDGWRVDVRYTKLKSPFSPVPHRLDF